MGSLEVLQKEIFDHKVQQGFNTTDVGKEIVLLAEELGELASAYRDHDNAGIVDAVGDMLVYLIGLCEILGVRSSVLILSIVEKNRTRTHRPSL